MSGMFCSSGILERNLTTGPNWNLSNIEYTWDLPFDNNGDPTCIMVN